jgi:hypothetical protein
MGSGTRLSSTGSFGLAKTRSGRRARAGAAHVGRSCRRAGFPPSAEVATEFPQPPFRGRRRDGAARDYAKARLLERLCPGASRTRRRFDVSGHVWRSYGYVLQRLGDRDRAGDVLRQYDFLDKSPRLGMLGYGIADVETLVPLGDVRKPAATAQAIDSGWRVPVYDRLDPGRRPISRHRDDALSRDGGRGRWDIRRMRTRRRGQGQWQLAVLSARAAGEPDAWRRTSGRASLHEHEPVALFGDTS